MADTHATSSEAQHIIKLPNGGTAEGIMLHRGMANLQHEVDSADFAPQTKVYLAWLNDLNGNRFGLKITDAADKTLLRHTQFLDDAVKELAYADAPANAELTPDDFNPARKFYLPSAGLVALLAAIQWSVKHGREDVVVYSTHRPELQFIRPGSNRPLSNSGLSMSCKPYRRIFDFGLHRSSTRLRHTRQRN